MVMGSPESSREAASRTGARRTCAEKEEAVAGNLIVGEIGWRSGGVRPEMEGSGSGVVKLGDSLFWALMRGAVGDDGWSM
jgi:hypothetical protein